MEYPRLKKRIVAGVRALAAEYSEPLDAFALNTDEDGWTIYHAAAVTGELSPEDLTAYFSPNEWSSKGSTHHLDPANEILVELRDSIAIEDVFATFATSLLECRKLVPAQFHEDTWLTVASSDPSIKTEALELHWARELNSAAKFQTFVDWQASFPPALY